MKRIWMQKAPMNEPVKIEGFLEHIRNTRHMAFLVVRDRSGSDDFMRQQRQHIFIKGVVLKMVNPLNWHLIPSVVKACFHAVDSNVPVFYYPRIAYSLLFSTIRGVDMQSLDRSTMVTPYTTEGGGSVLLPNWDAIDPLIRRYYK